MIPPEVFLVSKVVFILLTAVVVLVVALPSVPLVVLRAAQAYFDWRRRVLATIFPGSELEDDDDREERVIER